MYVEISIAGQLSQFRLSVQQETFLSDLPVPLTGRVFVNECDHFRFIETVQDECDQVISNNLFHSLCRKGIHYIEDDALYIC